MFFCTFYNFTVLVHSHYYIIMLVTCLQLIPIKKNVIAGISAIFDSSVLAVITRDIKAF